MNNNNNINFINNNISNSFNILKIYNINGTLREILTKN